RLVDPGDRSFGPGDAGGVVIAAPENERLTVCQSGTQVTPQRLAPAQMNHRRRSAVTGQVLRRIVTSIDAAVVRMQAADEPAMLLLGRERPVNEALPIFAHFPDGEQSAAVPVEDDGGDVVVEQRPFAVAVCFSFE